MVSARLDDEIEMPKKAKCQDLCCKDQRKTTPLVHTRTMRMTRQGLHHIEANSGGGLKVLYWYRYKVEYADDTLDFTDYSDFKFNTIEIIPRFLLKN